MYLITLFFTSLLVSNSSSLIFSCNKSDLVVGVSRFALEIFCAKKHNGIKNTINTLRDGLLLTVFWFVFFNLQSCRPPLGTERTLPSYVFTRWNYRQELYTIQNKTCLTTGSKWNPVTVLHYFIILLACYNLL